VAVAFDLLTAVVAAATAVRPIEAPYAVSLFVLFG
jgi:hypothetical protein